MSRTAGSGYLVGPGEGGKGPGVLVLHSWWGLTAFFKDVCHRLADEGYTVLAPDLLTGQQPTTPDDAEAALAAADVDRSAGLVVSSARVLRNASADARAPIGLVGFSMGASWALWLSARASTEVAATVAFYGSQSIDFSEARSAYLGHFAEYDGLVSEDDTVELEAHLKLVGRDASFFRYPGTSHWFFEADRGPAYSAEAAALAWERTVAFLREHLPPAAPTTGPAA
ncbi:MAG: dienelactone hydrolase family protein [Acidimicrobiia bacterium]|nr:dienelactone hydrolase family protein [Acidimicrobiia bacterium]